MHFASIVWFTCGAVRTTLIRGTTLQYLNKGLGIQMLACAGDRPKTDLTSDPPCSEGGPEMAVQMNSSQGCLIFRRRGEKVAFVVRGHSDHNGLIEPWHWQRVRDSSRALLPRIPPCRAFLQGCHSTECCIRVLNSILFRWQGL